MHYVFKTTSTPSDPTKREKPKPGCCKTGVVLAQYLQKSGEFIRNFSSSPQRHFPYRLQSNQMIIGGIGIDTTNSFSTERFRISFMVLMCACKGMSLQCLLCLCLFWSPSSLFCFPAVHRGIILATLKKMKIVFEGCRKLRNLNLHQKASGLNLN